MKTFEINILAEDHVIYTGKCESVIVPTIRGQYGILADHSNVISAIVPGELKWRAPGGENCVAAVSNGLVKVENNEVLILINTAELPEQIDAKRAERAAAQAKEELLQKKSIMEYRSAQAHLARALSRLRVKKYSQK